VNLDTALRDAHQKGNGAALVRLYTQAAEEAEDIDATCFYLTHAYVFALELGAPEAGDLNARLVSYGRAHPLEPSKDINDAD